jgi:hypothetical protein
MNHVLSHFVLVIPNLPLIVHPNFAQMVNIVLKMTVHVYNVIHVQTVLQNQMVSLLNHVDANVMTFGLVINVMCVICLYLIVQLIR